MLLRPIHRLYQRYFNSKLIVDFYVIRYISQIIFLYNRASIDTKRAHSFNSPEINANRSEIQDLL